MLSFSNSASFIEEIQYGYLLDTRDRLANSMYIPQSATTSASAGFSHQQRNRPEVASDSAQGFDGLSASRDFHSFKDRCGRTFKYHTEADLHALQVYDPKYIGDGNLDSGYTQTEFFSGRGSPYVSLPASYELPLGLEPFPSHESRNSSSASHQGSL